MYVCVTYVGGVYVARQKLYETPAFCVLRKLKFHETMLRFGLYNGLWYISFWPSLVCIFNNVQAGRTSRLPNRSPVLKSNSFGHPVLQSNCARVKSLLSVEVLPSPLSSLYPEWSDFNHVDAKQNLILINFHFHGIFLSL